MMQAALADLIRKYDVPTPRYTSYPSVPHWDVAGFTTEKWEEAVRQTFRETNETEGIGLYIHLPFCESLCTYCACNKRITKNHGVEIGYIQTLLKEWSYYLGVMGKKPRVRELHLGGGTPTFFSPENLRWLLSYLLEEADVHPAREFSFEGHPNNTTTEHLAVLYDLGFRRVSYGVQDLDPTVQKAINRIQPLENLQRVTAESRRIGYTSVSFDLIYGLPHQNLASITHTFEKVLALQPDRVSYYSYAHVPWVSPGQRGYSEADLPADVEKRSLYEQGRKMLLQHGYEDVGMDHFALPTDGLHRARHNGTLHRNFMGYTTSQAQLLIGLGASAISDAGSAYAQNRKKVEDYTQDVRARGSAVFKGHLHTREDLMLRAAMLEIACHGRVPAMHADAFPDVREKLEEMTGEGILARNGRGYAITARGRAFVRNVCAVFDARFQAANTRSEMVFSRAI